MKDEIKWALYLIGIGLTIGFTLIVYAHATFATKSTVETMDQRIYDIWVKVAPEKAAKESR